MSQLDIKIRTRFDVPCLILVDRNRNSFSPYFSFSLLTCIWSTKNRIWMNLKNNRHGCLLFTIDIHTFRLWLVPLPVISVEAFFLGKQPVLQVDVYHTGALQAWSLCRPMRIRGFAGWIWGYIGTYLEGTQTWMVYFMENPSINRWFRGSLLT